MSKQFTSRVDIYDIRHFSWRSKITCYMLPPSNMSTLSVLRDGRQFKTTISTVIILDVIHALPHSSSVWWCAGNTEAAWYMTLPGDIAWVLYAMSSYIECILLACGDQAISTDTSSFQIMWCGLCRSKLWRFDECKSVSMLSVWLGVGLFFPSAKRE